MLPDLRLVIVAVAVTILVVIKFGTDLASMLSDPHVGSADVPVRRTVAQHMLPENPNQRQFQTLAAARRVDELHRLLDLPTGTVSTFADGGREAGRNVGGPFVGANGTPLQAAPLSAAPPSSDLVPHAARSYDLAPRLGMTASPSPARIAAITAGQRDRLTATEQQAGPGAAPAPETATTDPDEGTSRVAATSPPDQPEDEVAPSDKALLRRVPLPRARTGIHAAAIHAAHAARPGGPFRRAVVRRPKPPAPAPDVGPFGALFGLGTAGN